MLSSGTILTLGIALPAANVNYVDFAGNLGGFSLYGVGFYGVGVYSHGGPLEPQFSADVSVGHLQTLAGVFTPVVTLNATTLVINNTTLIGNLTPAVALNAALTVDNAHFNGDLAPNVAFVGNIDIVGQEYFGGDLAPIVELAGELSFTRPMAGDIAPDVEFSGLLGLASIGLIGGIVPQVALNADLNVDSFLQANFNVTVTLVASSMISGPLWAPTPPCPPTMWTPTESCDSVEWEPSELCNG